MMFYLVYNNVQETRNDLPGNNYNEITDAPNDTERELEELLLDHLHNCQIPCALPFLSYQRRMLQAGQRSQRANAVMPGILMKL
jgi:hypothetical protein